MAKKAKIPNKRIVETFEKKGCNVSATCKSLNISRMTFYRWREESKQLNSQLLEVEESIIDMVETKLLSKINDGDITSMIFFLKTKGKKRGYVEKAEVEVTDKKVVIGVKKPDFLDGDIG